MEAARLFPGLIFETVSPVVENILPRMDIAAFVGFAASGPLHTPVAVEDTAHFRDIFGSDLPLAWDSEKSRPVYSYLGSAVEAFFRNGGRRCWVVRVADKSTVHTFQYTLPGVVRTDGERIEAVTLSARSAGSWARQYKVGTLLQVTQLQTTARNSGEDTTPVLYLDNRQWSVEVRVPAIQIGTGDLLKVSDEQERVFYGVVNAVTAQENGTRLSGDAGFFCCPKTDSSPPADGPKPLEYQNKDLYPLADARALGFDSGWPQNSPPDSILHIQLLRFEIQAWKDNVPTHRLSDVAFHYSHPRFFGALPSDGELYARSEGMPQQVVDPKKEAFIKGANQTQRFPFCAAESDASAWHYLPLDMGLLTDVQTSQGPDFINAPASTPEQDGLQVFGSHLFLDETFTWATASALAQEIEQQRYWKDSASKLCGIYSLFPVPEVTLVAVPDALHRRWDCIAPDVPDPLPAPSLAPIQETTTEDLYKLQWSAVEGATAYIVEQDRTADFKTPTRYFVRGLVQPIVGETPELLPVPDTSLQISVSDTCEHACFFRVRAQRSGEVSLWSNTRAKTIGASAFLCCDAAPPELWDLYLETGPQGSPPGKITFTWEALDGKQEALELAQGFELEQAADAEFHSGRIVYSGNDRSVQIKEQPDAVFYYRARARRGSATGPWSNTIRITPTFLSRMTLQPLPQFSHEDVLDVHRALLRLCKARGDMMALLSLPVQFRQEQIMDYLAALMPAAGPSTGSSANVPALTLGEQEVTGFAALYYPWLAVRTPSVDAGALTNAYQPPDGSIAGLISRRTLQYGAWYAPAGEALIDVVALEPTVNQDQWVRLLQSHVNIIQRQSRGFMPLGTETLNTDELKHGIHVRRLLILLRRLALREGNAYLFEPNSDDFRERVRHQFNMLLEQMYNRGAFAGSTAQSAYRVVADDTVNTRQQIDQGRLIVELYVAPSQPLKFLRVRLVQTGPQRIQVQEL